MRIALISDIHGNLPAFEAVLEDAERRGVDEMFILGDLVAGGPYPAEALARVRALGVQVVRGNTDELVVEDPSNWDPPVDEASRRFKQQLLWAREQLTADDLAYLRNLPVTMEHRLAGVTLRLFHATPADTWEAVLPFAEEERLEALFAGSEAQVAAYGHIHRPFLRFLADRRCVVNPGPVAFPGPLASYALLTIHRSGVDVMLGHVAYDVEDVVRAAARRAYPGAEAAAAMWRGRSVWPVGPR